MDFLKISISNFKSIDASTIDLHQGLNVLIGPNGAGKTNVLASLKFLKDVLMNGVGLAVAKGGGPSRVFSKKNKDTMSFELEFDYGKRTFRKRKRDSKCIWSISIEQKGKEKTPVITEEHLSIQSLDNDSWVNMLSIDLMRKSDNKSEYKHDLDKNIGKDLFENIHPHFYYRSGKNASITAEQEKKISYIIEKKLFGDKSALTLFFYDDRKFYDIYLFFVSLNEYNIIPERARQATEQVPFAKMLPNGFGISEVIYALIKKNYHKLSGIGPSDDFEDFDIPIGRFGRMYGYGGAYPSNKKTLDSALDNINREISAAISSINSVSVKIDPTTGRRFVVFESDNEIFFPDQVSDGTIKWLCIIASIFVGASKIYLLEEPENFLHPWMQQRLTQLMRTQAKQTKCIFLLTTHSTTLLNAVFPEELILVSSDTGSTIAERLKNKEEINQFLSNSSFRLGDAWVSGAIGGVPE